jgi:hypothetical protein
MEEAREDGIEIGEARGKAQKALEAARAMIDYGIPIENAALIAGVSVDEISRGIAAGGAAAASK